MTEEQKAAAHRIEYFLKAWEYAGVGKTIKTVQDSPDTPAAIDVADLRAILQAATRDDIDARFIAEHGHRLASLFGINAFDLADRDAQIMAVLAATRDTPQGDNALGRLTAEQERLGLYEMFVNPPQAAICDAPTAIPTIFYNGDTKRDPALRSACDAQVISGIDATRSTGSADAVDAQRYRWLKARRDDFDKMAGASYYATQLSNTLWRKDDWDTEIDKAIAASAPKGDGND